MNRHSYINESKNARNERNRKRRIRYNKMKQTIHNQLPKYNDRSYVPGLIALSLFYNDPTIIWPVRYQEARNVIINDHIVGNSDW